MGPAVGEIRYARRNGRGCAVDAAAAAGSARRQVVLMPRPDFSVAFLDVPRAAEERAREYLGYRLRALYPAPVEETAFDFRLLRTGRALKAVVFVTRRSLLERYRALGAPVALPFSLLEAAVPRLVREGGLFVFVHPEWLEALAVPGARWRSEARSSVLPRGASLADDLAAALDSVGGAGTPVRVLASRALSAHVREALSDPRLARRGASLHEVEERASLRRAALFAAAARPGALSWSLRLQALLFAALALGTLAFVRSVARDRAYLASLQARLGELRAAAAGAAADRGRAEALSAELAALEARRPVDVHGLLCELARGLGGDVRVSSLIVDGRQFQLEAEGGAALELVARLREGPWFEAVRLLQIVPSPGGAGQERFRLTGALRAQ